MDTQTAENTTLDTASKLNQWLDEIKRWNPQEITPNTGVEIDRMMRELVLETEWADAFGKVFVAGRPGIEEYRTKLHKLLVEFLGYQVSTLRLSPEKSPFAANTVPPKILEKWGEALEDHNAKIAAQKDALRAWMKRYNDYYNRLLVQASQNAAAQLEQSPGLARLPSSQKAVVATLIARGAADIAQTPKAEVKRTESDFANRTLQRLRDFEIYRQAILQLDPALHPSLFNQMTTLIESHKKSLQEIPFSTEISKNVAVHSFYAAWTETQLPMLLEQIASSPEMAKFLKKMADETNTISPGVSNAEKLASDLHMVSATSSKSYQELVIDFTNEFLKESPIHINQRLTGVFLKHGLPLSWSQALEFFRSINGHFSFAGHAQPNMYRPSVINAPSSGGTTSAYAPSSLLEQALTGGLRGGSALSRGASALSRSLGARAAAGAAARFIPLPIVVFLIMFIFLPLVGITFLADPVSTMSNVSITMTTFITALTPGEQWIGSEEELLPGDPGYGTGDSSNPGVVMGKDGTPPPSELTECPVSGGSITQFPGGDYSHSPTAKYPCSADLCVYAFDIGGGGMSVVTTHDGTVDSYRDGCPPGECSGYGNFVKLKGTTKNGEAFYTIYAHLLEVSDIIINYATSGEVIFAGTTIGTTDNTGSSSGPHLHYGYSGPDKAGFVLPDGCAGF